MRKFALFCICLLALPASAAWAEDAAAKFRQLGALLPTPNAYRNAAGAPGAAYWQQRADYRIQVRLDERRRRITGSETIRYANASPDTLRYLWLQLDQNRFRSDSLQRRSETAPTDPETGEAAYTFGRVRRDQAAADRAYGHEIQRVRQGGADLPYSIVETMLRIDLPEPLPPGGQLEFSLDWAFNIVEEAAMDARGGYEHFPETDTYLYSLAQWFPRMAAYTDYGAWQNKQFLGRGEFTLEFGDYEVEITVPADHIVAATGVLQNPEEVLSETQRQRLQQARQSTRAPVFIVTPEEARSNEQERSSGTKTWRFSARNVRDFAFASSRKFIWDAMIHEQDDAQNPQVLVMSFYPSEAQPLWSKYSSHAVAHALSVYSRFSFPYPYPTMQSVNTWQRGGMEYPMITFNGYRPQPTEIEGGPPGKELTWPRGTKQRLIGVIIHEVGHNYFPMIVNSDERQWTWMDEGINSFLQYLAEREWEEDFHAHREFQSALDQIAGYMRSEGQVPVMTQSDSILQFGPNAYGKPAAALMVLRETVLGRALFDFAFREYARRWRFKRPMPVDFFRSMEDASAVDLDWFWRAWFYGTEHVDVALTRVREFQLSSQDPDIEFPKRKLEDAAKFAEPIVQIRNREEGRKLYIEGRPELEDFYNEHDRYTVSNKDRNAYREFLDSLQEWERIALERALEEDHYIYFIEFANLGGMPTPLPLALTYEDGSAASYDIPAEIWRRNSEQATKALVSGKRIVALELDPRQQTADLNRANNFYPPHIDSSRLELQRREDDQRNLMADMLVELKEQEEDKEESQPAPVPESE